MPAIPFLTLLLSLAPSTQRSEPWELLSFRIPRNVGCSPAPTDVEGRWTRVNHGNAQEIEQSFHAPHPSATERPTVLMPGKPIAIALVKQRINCRDAAG